MTDKIHAATLERAKKHGVIMQALPDRHQFGFEAHWTKFNHRMQGDSPKVLLDDMVAYQELKTQFSSFSATQDERGAWTIVAPYDISSRAPSLAHALKGAVDAWKEHRASMTDEELQEEADEEDLRAAKPDDASDNKSVVSSRYRANYAERGHANHCGDWLATTLNGFVANKKGTNVDLFLAICAANGVDLSAYSRETAGWQGRIRMTGRNKLAKVVFVTRVLKLPEQLGEAIPADPDWIKAQRFVNMQEGVPK